MVRFGIERQKWVHFGILGKNCRFIEIKGLISEVWSKWLNLFQAIGSYSLVSETKIRTIISELIIAIGVLECRIRYLSSKSFFQTIDFTIHLPNSSDLWNGSELELKNSELDNRWSLVQKRFRKLPASEQSLIGILWNEFPKSKLYLQNPKQSQLELDSEMKSEIIQMVSKWTTNYIQTYFFNRNLLITNRNWIQKYKIGCSIGSVRMFIFKIGIIKSRICFLNGWNYSRNYTSL